MSDITVMIPCRNNADFIVKAVRTFTWADHILIVDSYSADNTLEVAERSGARVIQRTYDTSARQKNWALEHVATTWVFQIDTDEDLEDGLASEILHASRNASPDVVAFTVPRKNHYGSKWLRYGGLYPDRQTRLLRTGFCRWSDRAVHAHVLADGRVQQLEGHIMHHGMPSISKQVENLDRYTSYECTESLKVSVPARLALLYHPGAVFLYRYVARAGFLDGWAGFVLACYAGVYDFIRLVKVLEQASCFPDESRTTLP